ncbi:MAG: hypothetical protein M1483_05365 [Actinobacteria bacterium]|nr:hypothetical protein [Actinomycetota bacterium]MCL6105042.1 hypothetical protein [Actinomycetota bacterium]
MYDNILEFPSVKKWFESANHDSDTQDEQKRLLDMIANFCESLDQTPDELIESCLRTTKDGDTAISAKGRKNVQQAIDDWVTSQGLSGHQAIVTANTLRSFLIHNGVFIQGPASIQ